MKSKKLVVKILKKDTYLAMIQNACGSKMWANNYALVNGKKEDIVQEGAFSCAFFVCSVLKIFDLIREIHVTVLGAEKDLKESGWQEIKISSKMPAGSVIIWQKTAESYHIGFFIGNKRAVSVSSGNKFPIIHHWTYYGERKVIKAYWNTKISNL